MNLWTKEEDKILSDTSVPYDSLLEKLPSRSKRSIWSRAHKLGYSRDASAISVAYSEMQRKEEWTTLLEDKEFCKVIDGELLGDGCVFRKGIKSGTGYEYTFIAGSIHKEYAEYLHGILAPKLKSKAKMRTISPPKNKKSGYPTNKPFYSVRFSSVVFKNFYARWYPEGSIKITYPKDLELTPTTCLHWYLGDGSLDSSFRRRMFEITLHTENFKHSEVDKMSELIFCSLNINTGVQNSKKYKKIRIHGQHARQFLEYIGPSPIECFKYKWKDWKKKGG